MIRKKIGIILVFALLSLSIVLPGCSKNAEPDVAKNNNTNQPPSTANSNNASSIPITPPAANNVAVPANINKNNKPLPPVKEPTPKIGSGASDMFLFTQARLTLTADKELINAVIIEIKEGNATLTGNVSSEAQKTKAEQLVKSVSGIKSVKNNLRVSP